MILTVLLPLLVAAEWVEITQNYRKENQPSRYDYTSNNNYTVVEHQWGKGHVRKINNPNKRIQTNERKIERNPFNDDMSTGKPGQSSQIQYPEIFLQGSKNQGGNENISRNKHESSKVIGTKTINSKTRPDIEKEGKQSVVNTKKVNQNAVEKESGDKNKESQTTPCPDFIGNAEIKSKENGNLNHDKIETKTNAIETLMKFLKMVSQTIKQGTRRTFKSKIRYLEHLRDHLLANIETRIDSIFPDDKNQRKRRAAGVESRGHIEFPSSESALMTISFLTFAVFLIKLVLQVIHTYKAKTMMVTPAVVATVGRAVLKKTTPN